MQRGNALLSSTVTTMKVTNYNKNYSRKDIPGNALRLLGGDGLKLTKRLIDNVHETGEGAL